MLSKIQEELTNYKANYQMQKEMLEEQLNYNLKYQIQRDSFVQPKMHYARQTEINKMEIGD